MEDNKKLEELEAYRARLENDISRARLMGHHLDRNVPLTRNYQNVVQEINKLKG